MQQNIHRSIWCVKLFLFLAILLALVACSNNGSTPEGRESDVSIDVSNKEVASEDQEKLEETVTPALNEDDAKGNSEDIGRAKESDSVTEKVTLEEGTESEKTVDRSLFARLQDYEWRVGDNHLSGVDSISGRFLLLGPEKPNTHCYFKKWPRTKVNDFVRDSHGLPAGFALTGDYSSMETRHVADMHEVISPEPNVVYSVGGGDYVVIDETFTAVASGESIIVEVGSHNFVSEVLFHSCELSSTTQAFAIQDGGQSIVSLTLRPPIVPFEESKDFRCRYQYDKDVFQQICPEDVSSSCYYRVMRHSEAVYAYPFSPKLLGRVYYRADVIDDRYTEIGPGEIEVVRVGFDSIMHNCKIDAS